MFQVWSYSVSHGQLLLRSPPSEPTLETNLEILFGDVTAMQVRAVYDQMRLRAATSDEVFEIMKSHGGGSNPDTQFVLLGDDLHMGWVVCSRVVVAENTLKYWQPPELTTSREVGRDSG
jgi:hypothetical protein